MLFIKRFKNFLNPFKQRIFGTFHKKSKDFFLFFQKTEMSKKFLLFTLKQKSLKYIYVYGKQISLKSCFLYLA